jgi:hypothetical protein
MQMKRELKQLAVAAIAASCAMLVTGCETMIVGAATDDVAEAQTRARVLAELHEAQRLGLVTVGEEDIPWFTDDQNHLIAVAGDTAVTGQTAASRTK